MSSDHQGIAVRICYSPATVAPKHIHDWHDNARPKLDGFGHDFIGVFDGQVQGHCRAAECFGAPHSAIWILGSEHERGAPESQFRMHGFAVWPFHDAPTGKAEGLLIEACGGLYIGHGKHCCNGTVLLLVEGIDLLWHW